MKKDYAKIDKDFVKPIELPKISPLRTKPIHYNKN